ncbi:MAG TPA: hypothetical protein PKD18_05180 [Saprospiraceae bacterium]|nr:hypothetical protein [Saprospiraceae bacterium]
MEKIESFIRNPQETTFEILLEGIFDVNKLSPLWFYSNKLLGKEEAENVNEKKFEENIERTFSTKFIDFKITKDKIFVGVIDLKLYDLLIDLIISISTALKNSINCFYINLFLHYTSDSSSSKKNILLKSLNMDLWNQIIENPFSASCRIHDKFTGENYNHVRTFNTAGCTRENLKHPYHIFVFNNFTFDNSRIKINEILTQDFIIKKLNATIKLVNNYYKLFNNG